MHLDTLEARFRVNTEGGHSGRKLNTRRNARSVIVFLSPQESVFEDRKRFRLIVFLFHSLWG